LLCLGTGPHEHHTGGKQPGHRPTLCRMSWARCARPFKYMRFQGIFLFREQCFAGSPTQTHSHSGYVNRG
jgi:hypothetical protein